MVRRAKPLSYPSGGARRKGTERPEPSNVFFYSVQGVGGAETGDPVDRRQNTGDRRHETQDTVDRDSVDMRQKTGDRRQETGDRRQEIGDN